MSNKTLERGNSDIGWDLKLMSAPPFLNGYKGISQTKSVKNPPKNFFQSSDRAMPEITEFQSFGGATEKLERLGLQPLYEELLEILTGFSLRVEESKNANSGKVVRELIDARFSSSLDEGWTKKQTGGVDWTKCKVVNGTRVCIGVEIQVSGRSDLVIVDLIHLRDDIMQGEIDVGNLVVPDDVLGTFLADRAPYFSAVQRILSITKAEDYPIIIHAIT